MNKNVEVDCLLSKKSDLSFSEVTLQNRLFLARENRADEKVSEIAIRFNERENGNAYEFGSVYSKDGIKYSYFVVYEEDGSEYPIISHKSTVDLSEFASENSCIESIYAEREKMNITDLFEAFTRVFFKEADSNSYTDYGRFAVAITKFNRDCIENMKAIDPYNFLVDFTEEGLGAIRVSGNEAAVTVVWEYSDKKQMVNRWLNGTNSYYPGRCNDPLETIEKLNKLFEENR